MAAFERVLWIALGGLMAAIVGYLGAYFTEKGKNYATKEDFDDLRIQQQELTRATKQVEATISKDLWDQKRQWELKRDTFGSIVRTIADFENANFAVIASFSGAKKAKTEAEMQEFTVTKTKAIEVWQDAQSKFDAARLLTSLIGDEEVDDALVNLGVSLRQAYTAITQNAPDERFRDAMARANDYHDRSLRAIRAALGFE